MPASVLVGFADHAGRREDRRSPHGVLHQLADPDRGLGPGFGRAPVGSLIRLHMDPEDRTPIASDSVMLAALPEQGVEAFVDAATARPEPR